MLVNGLSQHQFATRNRHPNWTIADMSGFVERVARGGPSATFSRIFGEAAMKWMWLGALIAVLPACGEPERKSELQEALSGSIKDSSSLEFRNVAEENGLICGELNSRADHGTDRKFKVFVFDRAQNVLRTEDEQEPDEVSAFYNDLRSRCSNGSKLLNEIHTRKDDVTGG